MSIVSHRGSTPPLYGFSPSSNVCQHLWECVRHHPEVVFRYGQVSPPDATGQRIHPLPPDPKPTEAEAGGVLPTRLDVHQRHRHEHGTRGSAVCVFYLAQTITLSLLLLSSVASSSLPNIICVSEPFLPSSCPPE